MNFDNKELWEKVQQEARYLLYLLAALLVLFWIAFYRENSVLTTLRFTLSLFWMFMLPGFFLLYYWEKRLSFLERFLLGIIISISVLGVSSYYLNLLGIHVRWYGYLIPAAQLLIAGIILRKRLTQNKAERANL